MFFIWNPRNRTHIAKHGVEKDEAEYVVRHASPPFPRAVGEGKYKVWGAMEAGRLLQVVYALRDIEEIGFHELPAHIMMLASHDEKFRHVIHARDLSESEKRRFRRRRG